MRKLEEYNPIVIFVYFLIVTGFAMFIMDPVILGLSLLGSLTLFFMIDGFHGAASHITALVFFVVMAIVNPLFNHNGVTILFFLNNNPITLEALMYGVFAAAMIIGILYRLRTFTLIMTADKLLYIFGRFSPKMSLILSMALRYVPLMRTQTDKVRRTQKALGIYRGDNIADTLKGEMRIFSIMATWSLENGIITADSMAARGYGEHRRTSFSLFKFTKGDALFLILCIIPTAVVIWALAAGEAGFEYYPAMSGIKNSALALSCYISYGFLSFLPVILEWKEELRWKYLMSKI